MDSTSPYCWSYTKGIHPRPSWPREVYGMALPHLLMPKNYQSFFGSITSPCIVGSSSRISILCYSRASTISVLLYSMMAIILFALFSLAYGTTCRFQCYLCFGRSGATLCSIKRLALYMLSLIGRKMRYTINC